MAKNYPAVTLTRAPSGLDTPLAEVFGDTGASASTERVEAADPEGARASRRTPASDGLARFEELGLRTVEDLLRYYPRRYVTGESLTRLDADLRAGKLDRGEQGEAVFYATVLSGETITTRKRDSRGRPRQLYKVRAVDEAGTHVSMIFFNLKGAEHWFGPGTRAYFFGKVSVDPTYGLQLTHPDFHRVSGADGPQAAYASGMLPIYPATARADSWGTGLAILQVLDALPDLPDPLPERIRDRRALCSLPEALDGVHRPREPRDHRRGRERLAYEEAFVLQAELVRRRAATDELPARPRTGREAGLVRKLDERLPFRLTGSQRRVGEQIAAELARPHPMHRLLQGDVGSGKTVVALRAMLTVVDAGGQAALLAPTEVLAQQHHRTIMELLGSLAERGLLGGEEDGTRVALLTGSQATGERRRQLLEAASGEAGIVVGTHALLQEKVDFADLGLVVVDEQHRFGVEQRAALGEKSDGMRPHVLVMTATPIPRTVAMTIFGDLAVSTLDEGPAGRAGTVTHVVNYQKQGWADRTWQRVREEVEGGRQVYVVCPRISAAEGATSAEEVAVPETAEPGPSGPSGASGASGAGERPAPGGRGAAAGPEGGDEPSADGDHRSAGRAEAGDGWTVLETAASLAEGPLSGLRVAALHGRMPAAEKDRVMREFADGRVDVLVSTTVIEVGVDVPNASTMVILDADWFGVSQLHQLRGRIGRGAHPGLCLLVHRDAQGGALRRLEAVEGTTDGFELSREDLRQRREGDILGASQHGFRSTLRLLRVPEDAGVIERARQDAADVSADDPWFEQHPELVRTVDRLYGESRTGFLEKS